MRTLLIKLTLLVSPFVIFSGFVVLNAMDKRLYRSLMREDHIIENLTSLNYFLGSVLAFLVAYTFWRQRRKVHVILFGLLALFLFIFCGEEISWGQRIFNIPLPAYFMENSFQYEINIHNLKQISKIDYYFAAKVFALVGLYGGSSWLVLRIFESIGIKKPAQVLMPYFVPAWYVSGFFLVVGMYFYYLAYPLQTGYRIFNIGARYQELTEFILSLAFLVFTMDCHRKLTGWRMFRYETRLN
jgi:hypothetical protein